MADFPAIKPTARSYNPGDYPVKSYQALSGTKWKRVFGNKRIGMSLALEFGNIADSDASRILGHYETQGGTVRRFAIPSTLLAGMSSGLQASVALPPNVRWAYESPPDVRSVFPGVSTVSVSLIGEVDYQ